MPHPTMTPMPVLEHVTDLIDDWLEELESWQEAVTSPGGPLGWARSLVDKLEHLAAITSLAPQATYLGPITAACADHTMRQLQLCVQLAAANAPVTVREKAASDLIGGLRCAGDTILKALIHEIQALSPSDPGPGQPAVPLL